MSETQTQTQNKCEKIRGIEVCIGDKISLGISGGIVGVIKGFNGKDIIIETLTGETIGLYKSKITAIRIVEKGAKNE